MCQLMYVLQYSNFDELERKSEGRLFQHPQGTAADKTSDLRFGIKTQKITLHRTEKTV